MFELTPNKLITACLTHCCTWCGEYIIPGEQAVLFSFAADGTVYHDYQHPECSAASARDTDLVWTDDGYEPYAQERGKTTGETGMAVVGRFVAAKIIGMLESAYEHTLAASAPLTAIANMPTTSINLAAFVTWRATAADPDAWVLKAPGCPGYLAKILPVIDVRSGLCTSYRAVGPLYDVSGHPTVSAAQEAVVPAVMASVITHMTALADSEG